MNKTIQTHIERIRSGRFTKSEVGALTKLLSSVNFADDTRKADVATLEDKCFQAGESFYERPYSGHGTLTCQPLHFDKPCKLTKEQTTLGKAWLRQKYYKLNGKPNAAGLRLEDSQGSTVLAIAGAVSRFEFVGVLKIMNDFGNVNQVLPIYRAYNRKGQHFDYSPIHWGEPVFSGGSND